MGNAIWSVLAHQPESSLPSPDDIYCTLASQHIETGDTAAAIRLLNNARDVNRLSEYCRLAPLHLSVARGNDQCVQHLIKRGANINVTDCRMFTPLHVAAEGGESVVDSCQLLIDNGADIDAQDIWGKTPLQRAIAYNNSELAKLLVHSGCNINKTDQMGQSAMAYLANNIALVQTDASLLDVLLRNGGDLTLKDAKGKSPLYHALLVKNLAVLEKIGEIPREKVDFTELVDLALSRCYVDYLEFLLKRGASFPSSMVNDKLLGIISHPLNKLDQVFITLNTLLHGVGQPGSKEMVLEVVALVVSCLRRHPTFGVRESLVKLLCAFISINCMPLAVIWPVLSINASIAENVKCSMDYDNIPTLTAICRKHIRELLLLKEPNIFVGVDKLNVLPQALRSFLLLEEF